MSWQRNPSPSSQVTRGANWKRTRRRILNRDGHECQIRGPRCAVDANEVDKIIPASRGGSDTDDDNLRAVCPPCHKAKTARETAAGARSAHRARRSPKRRPRIHPADVC
jgi:5-methylcytosine-specific restriction protein A